MADISDDDRQVRSRNATRVSLLERVKDPTDEAAWREFSDIYRPYLAVVARNGGVSTDEIDDVLQQVLTVAWQKLPDFEYARERGRFRGWLTTITLRIGRRARGKSQRLHETLAGDKSYMLDAYTEEAVPPELDAIAERAWKVHLAQLAWQRVSTELAPSVRDAFERILNNQTPKQIAADIGLK